MPPDLDIYVVSKLRDRDSLERFVATYVDREADENRGDEQLMMLPLGSTKDPLEPDEWDWEPATTLSHILCRGLEHPRRAFAVYLNPKDKTLSGVTLAFTADNQVVFGLSIDDADHRFENIDLAKRLLHSLAESFNGHLGAIAYEEPPPFWEKEFQNIGSKIYLWRKA